MVLFSFVSNNFVPSSSPMRVHLRKKKLKDGSHSLLLDYHKDGMRHREYLGIYIKVKDNDSREKMRLASTIAAQREIELSTSGRDVIPEHKKRTDFVKYFQDFISLSPRKKVSAFDACLKMLVLFSEGPVVASDIDEKFCQRFRNFLGKNLNGETPHNYFACFKQVLTSAVSEKIFLSSPAYGVRNPLPAGNVLRKEVLTDDEVILLYNTHLLNSEVKRAFLFACFTGMRAVDLRSLRWRHVDFRNRQIFLKQTKTGLKYVVPLNKTAFSLLGDEGSPDSFIFRLTTQEAINKALKTWATRAKIKKHITFHCSRHTYGTSLMVHGANESTTSKLLGHTSTRQTQKYTHISERMKRKAVDALPQLEINRN